MENKYFVEIDADLIQFNQITTEDNDLVLYTNLWTLENFSGEIFKRDGDDRKTTLSEIEDRSDKFITLFLNKDDSLENLDYLHSLKDKIDGNINFMTLKKSFTRTALEEHQIPQITDTGELIEYFNNLQEILKNLQ